MPSHRASIGVLSCANGASEVDIAEPCLALSIPVIRTRSGLPSVVALSNLAKRPRRMRPRRDHRMAGAVAPVGVRYLLARAIPRYLLAPGFRCLVPRSSCFNSAVLLSSASC